MHRKVQYPQAAAICRQVLLSHPCASLPAPGSMAWGKAFLIAFAACYVVQWAEAGVEIETLKAGKLQCCLGVKRCAPFPAPGQERSEHQREAPSPPVRRSTVLWIMLQAFFGGRASQAAGQHPLPSSAAHQLTVCCSQPAPQLSQAGSPLPGASWYPCTSLCAHLARPGLPAGDGVTFPQPNDRVSVHYTGKLTNGQVFDSSVERKRPFEFQIGAGQVGVDWLCTAASSRQPGLAFNQLPA